MKEVFVITTAIMQWPHERVGVSYYQGLMEVPDPQDATNIRKHSAFSTDISIVKHYNTYGEAVSGIEEAFEHIHNPAIKSSIHLQVDKFFVQEKKEAAGNSNEPSAESDRPSSDKA